MLVIVSLNVIICGMVSFKEEMYRRIKPPRYMLIISKVNSLLLFRLGDNTENRKLIDGKNMAFMSLWASVFSIWLFISISEVKITLLGNPFKMPIIIILAPFPLILNRGILIY